VDDATSYPDARIVVSTDTKGQGLEAGIKDLNPILQQIMKSVKSGQGPSNQMASTKFGRLTFSEHG
jgi:hypothetical protein